MAKGPPHSAMERPPGPRKELPPKALKLKKKVKDFGLEEKKASRARISGGCYPGTAGRTLSDLSGSARDEKYDGLNELLIKRTWEATQTLHSILQPITPERDVRHNEDDKYMVYVPAGSHSEKSERAGVTHLVQCWTMQGHSKGPFMPSSDFFRGCQAALAVKHYYTATKEVAIYLSCMFEVAYPEYHAKYTRAFKAGVWERADPGPWIGRAIVYKLQVSEHVDGLDDGPIASFCVGDFDGGPMYLPDIGMKLSYRQGDILIFMSGLLYHCVGKWTPTGGISPERLTPGRISHVFFSPQKSIPQLEGKPEGWMVRTMGGISVDSDESAGQAGNNEGHYHPGRIIAGLIEAVNRYEKLGTYKSLSSCRASENPTNREKIIAVVQKKNERRGGMEL
ncbi:hypothetical protein B0H11DRAFT_1914874 [Mycena galericulata]|nr:hypothetical protein B0H11DRAFT_1914874 [Mycena galericulata]